MHSLLSKFFLAIAAFAFMPEFALAADHGAHLPADLSVVWVIPFACMLLSIALGPLLVEHFWHHNYGKVALGWGLAFLIPCTFVFGFDVAMYHTIHTMLLEYVPFIVLLLALFTVAGGIRLKGSLVGTPVVNTTILAIGTCIASIMGTTGAAMLLIRPLLRANAHRKYRVHQVVFFIFLVANIGGSLSPLGDPPLFLGFLKGVSFFWTTEHLLLKTLMVSVILLVVYFGVDTMLFNKEGKPTVETKSDEKLGFDGQVNFLLLPCVIACVLMSGYWKPGIEFDIYGTHVALPSVVRDVLLLCLTAVSLKLTSKECRDLNGFNWEPIAEVAKLFIGIFLSMIPAIVILGAGLDGALASVIELVSNPDGTPNNMMFFWVTGLLSGFLDNAPTYLVFFNTAGGDAQYLMTQGATTLAAISAGAVFMGAMTYIGNAPNFMVKAIASDQGVPMPSFFGYMAWSVGFLVPVFALVSILNFL